MVALDELGADRIGHGVQAIHDAEIVARLAKDGVPLELCPWSNVLTRAVPDLKSHPFKRLMDAGVKTTVNTDDHGVMDISLIQECENLTTHLGVSLKDLRQCNQWAREASFIAEDRIQAVWTA